MSVLTSRKEEELMLRRTGTEEIVEGMPIFKQGRATDFTAGTVGRIKADINLGDDQIVYSAWVVEGWFQKAFAEPGDSGAVCWDQFGEWCGLLFGGATNGFGYFIPAQVIVDDVNAVTGCALELPKLESKSSK